MPWRGYAEPLSSPPTVPSPPVAQRRATETAAGTASPGGRVLWLLGSRCVELLLPSGRVRTISHTGAGLNGLNVPAGSRAVADPKRPGQLYLLENGSSTLWSYDCASGRAESLTPGAEATRFRSSLGSRFVLCGRRLLVTGTPNQGAHSPWIFDLNAQKWSRLPDAPCAILSSAVAVDDDDAAICILGGWSKMQSCHGYLQRLSLKGRDGWQVSSGQVPWRRPGAATTLADGRIVVGFGWMECASAAPVGSRDFKLLRRNGGAQQAETSASRLVAMRMEGIPSKVWGRSFKWAAAFWCASAAIMCKCSTWNLPPGRPGLCHRSCLWTTATLGSSTAAVGPSLSTSSRRAVRRTVLPVLRLGMRGETRGASEAPGFHPWRFSG
ncbi:unnamed protein product [Cladocopium goreaui]|uniref:Uncharacterized protein n=1 Tax=Cladocopium goreaui TaxID=2562237 RepID=A0A9P1DNT3_9DINO|nr:unnamed protein product [Cladocopium goreaui]